MRNTLAAATLCLVLCVSASNALTETKEIKGEIAGIGPKTVTFYSEESFQVGEEIQVLRKDEVIALLRVSSIKGQLIITNIVKKFGEPDFDDTFVRFSAPAPPEEKKETPPEIKPEETPVIASETKPNKESVSDSASISKEKQTEVSAEEHKEPATVTPSETPAIATPPSVIPSEAKESQKEKPEEIAKIPEPVTVLPSEEPAGGPQTFGVSFGYSLFVPNDFKVSNGGFRGEARVKLPTVKNLYGALSYAQHAWTDKTTELKLNVLSVNLSYSLKSFLPQTFSFVNDVQVAAGYSNISSRLSQDTTTLTKSASGFNTGIALRLLKFLTLDYRFHSFTLNFPNGKLKNGEQLTLSFSYAF